MTSTAEFMMSHHPSIVCFKASRQTFWATLCVLLAVFIGVFILNPIWQWCGLHVPGEQNTKADITYPVDTVFYIRNAELGYRWSIHEPTSIWFHPLLAWATRILPNQIPGNLRLYFLSIVSALFSLIAVYKYALKVFQIELNPHVLLLTILIPGGLNIAVGNAELPVLLFNSLLLLAIINRSSGVIVFLVGMFAILTKPNAIYMLAPIAVYGVYAFARKDKGMAWRCILGILGLILPWVGWMGYVDMRVGEMGAYWQARQIAMVPLYLGPTTLIYRTVQAIAFGNLGEILKFVTAFVIPLVDLWLALVTPFRDELHRLASISSILAMLLIALVTNNPNKMIVYAMTLPSHLAVNLLAMQVGFQNAFHSMGLSRSKRLILMLALLGYLLFCIGMVAFFVIGTPLEWYY